MTIEKIGRRHYLSGLSYGDRHIAKNLGCRWDPEKKMWWTGKAAIAEQALANAGEKKGNNGGGSGAERQIVAGRARYEGRTYYLGGRVERGSTHWDDRVSPVETRDGEKFLLIFHDGSSSFWAKKAEVEIIKSYSKPQSIQGLARFADRQKKQNESCSYCEEHGAELARDLDECPRCGADYDA